MKARVDSRRAFVLVLRNGLLVVLGVLMALGLVEMLMRAFPNWVPAEVRVNPPVRRENAFVDETYDLRQSEGDLYHYMQGSVVPSSPDQDPVVAHIHMTTDAHGFRNSLPEKATYRIVALGDSFTRGSGVATAWPQRLAEDTGTDVFNLGDVALGPQDELNILRQYGLQKKPQWVIMAYFEGNDLYDAAAYQQANPFILLRFGRYILGQSLQAWQQRNSGAARVAAVSSYRYPITVTINHKDLAMVFFSSYISWLSLSRGAIAASQNYRLVRQTILQAQHSSEAAGANFLLVYVPSKSHVYLPYLNDPETVASVFADVPALELDQAGYMQFSNEKATPQLTRQHMDDQARLVSDFAAENNIHFLDLTPTFQAQAGAGEQLYYPFDTHWNQQGHDLAADTIYGYMQRILPDILEKTAGQ